MPIIYRPCYATRNEVRRAMDMKLPAYANDRIDRNIQSASDSVEDLCKRVFYPADDTRKFDWPNYQYARPWSIWLNQNELADDTITLKVANGTVTIASSKYMVYPPWGPPFVRIELDRSTTASFGGGATPQRDIWVQGTFGYWAETDPAATLVPDINGSVTSFVISDGGVIDVGDWILIGSERMLVTDAAMTDTTVAFSGLTTASAADNVLAVDDGTAFNVGEVLGIDAEHCLIVDIIANSLVLKRAWDGTVLSTHTSGTIYSQRNLTVVRGALGTTAAAHSKNAAVGRGRVPALIRQLAVAEAIVGLTSEPGAYSAPGQIAESRPGSGIGDLRSVTECAYARKVRVRAI